MWGKGLTGTRNPSYQSFSWFLMYRMVELLSLDMQKLLICLKNFEKIEFLDHTFLNGRVFVVFCLIKTNCLGGHLFLQSLECLSVFDPHTLKPKLDLFNIWASLLVTTLVFPEAPFLPLFFRVEFYTLSFFLADFFFHFFPHS